jgi:hypothetical protein
MVPRALATRTPYIDVAAAMDERPRNRAVSLRVVSSSGLPENESVDSDPFAGIEV